MVCGSVESLGGADGRDDAGHALATVIAFEAIFSESLLWGEPLGSVPQTLQSLLPSETSCYSARTLYGFLFVRLRLQFFFR